VDPTFHDALQRHLSHDCKREHFEDARRPQFRLEQELQHLRAQLGSIDSSSEEYHVCSAQIRQLEKELENVKRNAAQDIYNRNNSAGRMGEVDAQGNVTVDLHGLYVREAISMFNELVLPILPAVRNRVAIITGKGRHSSGKSGGSAPLRSGLIAHIEKTAEYREKRLMCSVDKKNPGRVWVSWNNVSNNNNPRV
jgi:DNA-nicking Smr family endonuclease